MKIKQLTLTLSSLLLAGSALAADINLKFQSSNFTGEQVYTIQKKWADSAEASSNGRIHIDLLPLDAVLKSSDMLTGVRNNIIDGAVATAAMYSGEDPGFGLIGDTISAWNSDEDILKFYYYGGGFEVVDKVFQAYGAKLIGVSVTGAESLPSKIKMEKVEDFKGVKMRAPSGPIQKLFARMGAAPVGLPGSEIYTALEKGIIDAADFSTLANNQKQGVHDIAKYPIYPGIHSSPAVHTVMNLKKWNALSENDQTFLLNHFKGMAMDSLLQAHYEDQIAYGEALKDGVTPVAWSIEEKEKVRKYAKEIWKEIADDSEIGKMYYDTLLDFLGTQGML
ncbi:TRAP transporter substrate-binding protein [Vibrio sp. JC009]|uniref:TRAP transporter substrate-binding protein n=1 Tax=Vibrio sp. JC009 TaxID=2912314 RepID=UPI0023B14A1B|nr:TRAP transporter substrate-binding protein [Vibrio sp. JC009]WED24238.1 TRAP transporter substrate-binding protein [Vibrio sp. JC009]